MLRGKIVVIDDDELMRDSISETLKRSGHRVKAFADGPSALQHLPDHAADLIITDMKMPGMDGMTVMKNARAAAPNTPVIIITAYGSIDTAVEAMRQGAFTFITKPFNADTLEVIVAQGLEHRRLLAQNEMLKEEIEKNYSFDRMVGIAPTFRQVCETIKKVADSHSTILIRGESGTGKELVARAIHNFSRRRSGPFIKVNCAALSAGLLESELFGHVKGAFTGADRDRVGRFELADCGSILLDEVSEIDINLQSKLLRVIQEREFEKVGSSETIKVDVRVIATTNRDLEKAVEAGKFREDLFFRLNVVPLYLPPLRERLEDVPPLVDHFIRVFGAEAGRGAKSVSPEALKILKEYFWPGNIRELENVIERAVVLSSGEIIGPGDIGSGLSRNLAESRETDQLALRVGASLEEMERKLILATLEKFNGSRKRSAEVLGIADRTLRDKLKLWKEKGLYNGASEE